MHAIYSQYRNQILFGLMAGLLILVAVIQSPSVALTILNLCLISAIMSLGVNIQWGYAGLFNVGVMGFAALGGLAGVLVSMPPIRGMAGRRLWYLTGSIDHRWDRGCLLNGLVIDQASDKIPILDHCRHYRGGLHPPSIIF